MTTFGGLYSVRGYEEEEIVADGGVVVSAQYEFDIVKAGESLENQEGESEEGEEQKRWLGKFAPLAFVDFGRAKIKSPVVGEKEVQELCSVGTGAIFEVGENFRGAMYYGWPLRSTEETKEGRGRFNFSFILRF
jgi:hemolysin activation/secretion protein